MTITMIMVTTNIESKSDCVRRCSSRNALLNSLKPLGKNYKIRLEADIERKLKEKRNNIVEFIKERLQLDVIRIPNLVEQLFKIQFEFKAFFFPFFFPSPGIQVNVSGVVSSGFNFLFFINLDFGNNFCRKSIRDLKKKKKKKKNESFMYTTPLTLINSFEVTRTSLYPSWVFFYPCVGSFCPYVGLTLPLFVVSPCPLWVCLPRVSLWGIL